MSSAFLACSLAFNCAAAEKRGKATKAGEASASAPTTFAPLPAGSDLASIWNDPDFTRRLIGSYGFASDIEPRMTPDEQAAYRDKIVPLLREDPKKAIPALEALIKPTASATFDFTLGHILFQNEDLTNAVKHFETALAKFPDFRRAQKNLALALVRDGKYEAAIKPLTRTVTLGGGDGKVFGLLAFAYMNQGRHVSAEGAYRQALIFEPENVDFKLGLVKCAVGTANYDYALALLEELTRQYPERETLWTLQANLYIQKEQPAEAAISLPVLNFIDFALPYSRLCVALLRRRPMPPCSRSEVPTTSPRLMSAGLRRFLGGGRRWLTIPAWSGFSTPSSS